MQPELEQFIRDILTHEADSAPARGPLSTELGADHVTGRDSNGHRVWLVCAASGGFQTFRMVSGAELDQAQLYSRIIREWYEQ